MCAVCLEEVLGGNEQKQEAALESQIRSDEVSSFPQPVRSHSPSSDGASKEGGGMVITLCCHLFHLNCLAQWVDSTCPVCRYVLQPTELTACDVCGMEGDDLWICLVCGHVGCGRYKLAHAKEHFSATQHTFSLHIATQKVWDYCADAFVHRLLQSTVDIFPLVFAVNI